MYTEQFVEGGEVLVDCMHGGPSKGEVQRLRVHPKLQAITAIKSIYVNFQSETVPFYTAREIIWDGGGLCVVVTCLQLCTKSRVMIPGPRLCADMG